MSWQEHFRQATAPYFTEMLIGWSLFCIGFYVWFVFQACRNLREMDQVLIATMGVGVLAFAYAAIPIVLGLLLGIVT